MNRLDELVNQFVVSDTTLVGLPPSGVEIVSEKIGVVGSDVQADGQCVRRMDPGTERVESEFANRYRHAVGALVSKTEDALDVGEDDQADVRVRVPDRAGSK